MTASHKDLFAGVQAVADAGGLHGFVCEVIAEARTTSNAKLCQFQPEDRSDEVTAKVVDDALYDILRRRLQPDVIAEREREMRQRMVRGCHYSQHEAEVIAEHAMTIVLERASQRVQVILNAINQKADEIHSN